MEKSALFICIIALMCSTGKAAHLATRDDELNKLFVKLETELRSRMSTYNNSVEPLEKDLSAINFKISKTHRWKSKIKLVLERDKLRQYILNKTILYESDISKIRYLKGLQIIKILYEKVLDLDHHFASVSTLHEINRLTNPNEYAAFRNVTSQLSEKSDRKSGFDLSQLLGNNIYTSVIHSFMSLFNTSNTSRQEKEDSLTEVECIFDFTLRMHQDLNTIYFETSYLQKSNEAVLEDLEVLFNIYTRPINYNVDLQQCRENDDWGIIKANLDEYLNKINMAAGDESNSRKVRNMQINLQFPIDRLLQFITRYNTFIDQGSKFYEKFYIMLDSYENEEHCSANIPEDYKIMKKNITTSIKKFNTAYKPVEINGSKLKQLLYGINEYD